MQRLTLILALLLPGLGVAQDSRPAPDEALLQQRDQAYALIEELLSGIRKRAPNLRRRLMLDLYKETGLFLDTYAHVATPAQLDATGDIWLNLAWDAYELSEVRFRLRQLGKLSSVPPKLKTLMRSFEASLKLKPGVAAPAFEARRLDGKGKVSLAKLRGKVVLLDFWASWCPPCIESMKEHLEPLHERYKADERFALISVGVGLGDDTEEKQRAVFKKLGLTWTAAFAQDDGQASFGVRGLPHIVLIDEQGKILLIGSSVSMDDVRAALKKRLGKKGNDGPGGE